jgi:hypothetical protein
MDKRRHLIIIKKIIKKHNKNTLLVKYEKCLLGMKCVKTVSLFVQTEMNLAFFAKYR